MYFKYYFGGISCLLFPSGSCHLQGYSLPHLLEFREIRRLEVSHLRLVNSPFWTVHPFACIGVVIRNIEISNPITVGNTDGVDPDSSENVLIENLVYTGGDDAIAIKSGTSFFETGAMLWSPAVKKQRTQLLWILR